MMMTWSSNSRKLSDAVLASEEDMSFASQELRAPTVQPGLQAENLGVAKMPLALKLKTQLTSTALAPTLIP
jgi:hypothetical protein